MPAASESLVALKRQLADALLDFERLDAAWSKGRTAIERARISRQKREDALSEIVALRQRIASGHAVTLADAAVQLRRLAAMDEDDLKMLLFSAPMGSLVASVLAAVERALAGRDGAAAKRFERARHRVL